MRKHLSLAIVGFALAGALPVSAQVLQPPPRSSNGLFGGPRAGLDPNRVGHELSSNISLLGSYEDNLTPNGQGVSVDPLLPRRSGTSGVMSADMRYRYGSLARSIETNAQTFVHSFRNISVTPMYGGNANVRAMTELGRRLTFSASAEERYQPTFTLTATGSPGGAEAAPADPTIGAVELRSRGESASSSLTYAWSPRQRTNITYDYSHVRITGAEPTTTLNHEGTVGYDWDVQRGLTFMTSYRYSDRTTSADQVSRPAESHGGSLGLQIRKRLSRTRTVSFTGGGGAVRVRTISALDGQPFEYTSPSGYAGVRMDLWRTWAVSVDAHRDVSVLEGVATQSFLTDSLNVWIGGRLGPAWTLALSGAWSQARQHTGDVGSFEIGDGTAQLQYAISRCCSVLTSYSFYLHRLHDVELVSPGVPSRFERNAVSVGVTIFMPLYGQFPAQGTGRN